MIFSFGIEELSLKLKIGLNKLVYDINLNYNLVCQKYHFLLGIRFDILIKKIYLFRMFAKQ